ncbi:unnamed protein product [Effrenium voratum]|nr:unnamed protein product [Effrenium voratum]
MAREPKWSKSKINYQGMSLMLSQICGGPFFDYVYVPWPKLAVVNFISHEICQAAYIWLSCMESMQSYGLRSVKQAVFQGLAANLALFCSKSGYKAILEPGAPQVFANGAPVPLPLAVSIYLANLDDIDIDVQGQSKQALYYESGKREACQFLRMAREGPEACHFHRMARGSQGPEAMSAFELEHTVWSL